MAGEFGEPDLLLKIIFRAKEVSGNNISVKLEFAESSQVLLNDGFGTRAELTRKEAIFSIFPEKSEVSENEWSEEIIKDNIPPEPFEIEINHDPSILDGKYFITFLTTDKQTGLDYYEISETRSKKQEDWKRGTSPYLLEDQSLRSIIKVRAKDKAGNERIVEYAPLLEIPPFPWWLIILILSGMGTAYWFYRKSKWNIKNQK